MKYIATISLLLAAAASTTVRAEDKKPAPHPQTLTIPAGAVEAGESTWKYTDADGKKWIYRKSPFGVVRVEETAEIEKPVVASAEERSKRWKVTEEGDKVTFENASPFGPQRWTKKKSELNEDEKAALSRSQREVGKPAKAESKNPESKH